MKFTMMGLLLLLFLAVTFTCQAQVVGGQVVVGNVGSGATDSGNPVKVGGKYNSGGVTLTDGQRVDLQVDASGFLKVNVSAGSSGNAAASATGSAVPASADYAGLNVGGTLRGATAVNPSGSVYAQQIDLASAAGTTLATGNGVTGAGSPRVTIASDNTAFAVNATLQTGANVIGSLSANQSVNVAQINGVTTLMGNGVTGTGSQRVTIASDNTPFVVKALPSNGCGTTEFNQEWIAVPTANTAVTGTTLCIDAIVISNTNATAQTIAITDGQGSPITVVPTVSIQGNSMATIPLHATKATTGIKWQAGGTGMTGAVHGWQ